MNRRHFLQAAGALSLSHTVFGNALVANTPDLEYDRFGGWTGRQFEPTGYFRLEKDERWWLVSPEGNAFLSFGINHLHAAWWNQPYNTKAWKQLLNIDDLEGPRFQPALKTWFLKACRDYGFNSAGVHNQLSILNIPQPSIPYMHAITFVDIPHWKQEVPDDSFVDVFSKVFWKRCDRIAREVALPAKNDPFLIAYAMTDCPLFTEEDCRERPNVIGGAPREARIGWPRRLRNLSAEAPGKQAYVALMSRLYQGQIDRFNLVYSADFSSFDELEWTVNWRLNTDLSNGEETRDNLEFLKLVVSKYYQTTSEAIRRYDPVHLFVGDKLNANTDTVDALLSVTSKYTDLVLYQMYGRWDYQKSGLDRWSKITDKPFINGDAAFTMISPNMPRPYGPIADNVEQRAEWTREFFEGAFARPEFVGWHYCGLIDAPNLIPAKQVRQHSGLMNGYGEPYLQLRLTIKACSDAMYQISLQG